MERTGLNPFDWPPKESVRAYAERFNRLYGERVPLGSMHSFKATAAAIELQEDIKAAHRLTGLDFFQTARQAGIDPVYFNLMMACALPDDEIDPRAVVKICQVIDLDPKELHVPESWGKTWDEVLAELESNQN